MKTSLLLVLMVLMLPGALAEAGVRDHTRPAPSRDTPVSEAQGQVLSLTLAAVGRQQIQQWVRTAGAVDSRGTGLQARHCLADAALLAPGQRIIAFAPQSKSSAAQAWLRALEPQQGCVMIQADLLGSGHRPGQLYVMEIIVPRGRFLAVPKEAIIEQEGRSLVYVQSQAGHYRARAIHTGLRGERYTQVLHGLAAGEQVVTLGSFFIHAQQQLAAPSSSAAGSHAHHAH